MAWDLDISPSGVDDAATAYSTAATSFNDESAKMLAALNNLSGNWEGTAANTWATKVSVLEANLKALQSALNTNSGNLQQVSKIVAEMETELNTDISNM